MITDTLAFFTTFPTAFLFFIGFVGLFIGSFLNVVIYRLPIMLERSWNEECRLYLGLKTHDEMNKLNLCWPNSHCTSCRSPIKPWHNIPILSYIFLRGRCANCQNRISIRYPFVEALTCILSVYVALQFGCTWQSLAALVLTWICIGLTFIDIDHQLLPDQLTLTLLWAGLLFSLFGVFVDSHTAIIGAVAGYAIFACTQLTFERLTGKNGMGQGDVKFLAALGAYLGWEMLPIIILLASLTGVAIAGTQMLIKGRYKSEPLPFGPYLAIAGFIAMMGGHDILQHYFDLL